VNDEKAMLERWKALAGDTSPEPWTPDQMAGFFQCFRPDGQGLSQAFEGVECGEEILARLLEIYRATADGWLRENSHDGYFIVRNPPPTTSSQAEDLVRKHLKRVVAMAEAIGRAELTALLRQPPRIELTHGEAPSPSLDYDGPDSMIYEATNDFMHSLTPRESEALLMEEAMYAIACDYNLQYHCLWPLYRDATPIEEPFAPYFELWKRNLDYRFTGDSEVRVYVPEGTLSP